MKRIRVLLLTLALTLSMMAPEFAMLPAVYAESDTPAAVTAESNQAADPDASGAPAANEAADPATGTPDADPSADALEEADPGEAVVRAPDNGQDAVDPEPADMPDPAPADVPDPAPADVPDPEPQPFKFDSYKKLNMRDLYNANILVIPDELKDKITVEPAEYGSGLLLSGNVGDLNAAYLTISEEFNFDSGSVGRFYFDGLKDKDKGMDVEIEVYLDDEKTPKVTIPLKKQMGKREWANKGDKSVNLSTAEITGKHRVALRPKISGKNDTDNTTVMLRAIQFCKTTVPVMYFNIDESEGTIEAMNSSSDHSVECYGSVDLIVPDLFNANETFRDEYGQQKSLTGLDLEYIRGRGNSTWMDEKKPYKVKFDKGQDLFGFGKNKHWVLLANRYDNSLIRNRMTYWLGQQLGMEYTPQCVPVEVVMNGEFYGSYLLCEQIRVGKGRVTIDDLDDIKDVPAITDELIQTGGYLLSMDTEEDEKRSFRTENGMQLYIESPDDNVAYFNEYIKAYTQKVENAILGEDFKDASGQPYTDYLDIDSAVDYWWIQEFSANGDAYGSGSTYLYKKRDKSESEQGKLYWGPLWDFDYVAWGDLEYDPDPSGTLDYTSTPWFDTMKTDPVFIKKVKDRWYEEGGIKDKLLEITKEGGRLDKYIEQMETTYTYDHDLWGAYESDINEYKGEIEQLRTWINKRIEGVEESVKELSTDPHKVTFMVDGKIIKEKEIIGALRKSDFPEAPAKEGFVFSSWIDDEDCPYEAGSHVTQDVILNAYYLAEEEIVQAKDIFFSSYDVYYALYEDSENGYSNWYSPDYRVMPDNAFDTSLTWTSSNSTIAEVDEEGAIAIKGKGDAVITATLANGVSRSFNLHILGYEDFNECEKVSLDKTSIKLKTGSYDQVLPVYSPTPCDTGELIWVSTDESVACVDDLGVVSAVGIGTADILAVNLNTREVLKCKVTVTGRRVKKSGSIYEITSEKAGSRTATLVKARNAKGVTIPATITSGGHKYSVNRIKTKAFAKSKATKVIIRTKKLTKTRVKGSLKGSKVKTIKVKVGTKSLNKKYVKRYKKYFTKNNAGKKVKVY